jgi:hypothetical protein
MMRTSEEVKLLSINDSFADTGDLKHTSVSDLNLQKQIKQELYKIKGFKNTNNIFHALKDPIMRYTLGNVIWRGIGISVASGLLIPMIAHHDTSAKPSD